MEIVIEPKKLLIFSELDLIHLHNLYALVIHSFMAILA